MLYSIWVGLTKYSVIPTGEGVVSTIVLIFFDNIGDMARITGTNSYCGSLRQTCPYKGREDD
jgi:hypothetical protein